MKKKKYLILLCFLIFSAIAIVAQQGIVAAGGDATGAGGSMSYSIGQIDYLAYTSAQGSINPGVQQTWFIVPETLEIPAITIIAGENKCFDATETVIVAGNGKHFIVKSGAHADIIAGTNIKIKEGTAIEYGASLHAYISDVMCNQQPSMLSADIENLPASELNPETFNKSSFFMVYPNPTTGDFTLEMLKSEEASQLLIEIYTMQGNLVFRSELPVQNQHNLSLSSMQTGLYLIRVQHGYETGVLKIIKH
ncbi:MAG: T9SS type A sorting domain-containing protein [Bacteroidales bacterium]